MASVFREPFGTISSRQESFDEWPYTAPTPRQLAVAGFFHPCNCDPDFIACFCCGVEYNYRSGGALADEGLEEQLLALHREGCLWGDMQRDTVAHSVIATLIVSKPFLKLSSRLESFRKWTYSTFSPQQLAFTGYFYNRRYKGSNTVRCFCCGVINTFFTTSRMYTDDGAKVELLK